MTGKAILPRFGAFYLLDNGMAFPKVLTRHRAIICALILCICKTVLHCFALHHCLIFRQLHHFGALLKK